MSTCPICGKSADRDLGFGLAEAVGHLPCVEKINARRCEACALAVDNHSITPSFWCTVFSRVRPARGTCERWTTREETP